MSHKKPLDDSNFPLKVEHHSIKTRKIIQSRPRKTKKSPKIWSRD
jgi:hypothetical protein